MKLGLNRKIVATGVSILTAGISWLIYEIEKTKSILFQAFDSNLLSNIDSNPVKLTKPTSYICLPKNPHDPLHLLASLWNELKFEYALRLINMTKCDVQEYRLKATKRLASLKFLETSDYQYLAQKLDAETATALSRYKDVDSRLFMNPPNKQAHKYHCIMKSLQTFITNLNMMSKHDCLPYCIDSVFQDDTIIIDDDCTSQEFRKGIETDEYLLTCLKTILHHSDMKDNAKDVVSQKGLALLMEIQQRYSDNRKILVVLASILANICVYPEHKEEIFRTGWLGVLAKWTSHPNLVLSTIASKALANLDCEFTQEGAFKRDLYVLCPNYRNSFEPKTDVVLVHGLLGGVFFSWRQRDKQDEAVGLFDALVKGDDDKKTRDAIENTSFEFLKIMQTYDEERWKDIGKDYEMVMYDSPENSLRDTVGSFTYHQTKTYFENEVQDLLNTSECWPKDWLCKDCKYVRLIGLNYDTNLSYWAPVCPDQEQLTLRQRSQKFIDNLTKAHVGNRPIVWICHSMGGLLVKQMLVNAMNSENENERNIAKNTKGIIFCSTPHRGSQTALIKDLTALLVWPTIEVQELKENSPHLLELDDNFKEYLSKNNDIKIISFVESKPTDVSAVRISFAFVSKESADPGVGEFYILPLNHLDVCKPKNRNSFIYKKIVQVVNDVCNTYRTTYLKK